MPVEKFPLTKRDAILIDWFVVHGTGVVKEIAVACSKFNTISAKQRAVLESALEQHKRAQMQHPTPSMRKSGHIGPYRSDRFARYAPDYADHTEADYEIGAYELCVGEWGD